MVATPSRALASLQSEDLQLARSLESLVIDEADLILSYGHDAEVKAIFDRGFLSRTYQTFLMSATLSDDVDMLSGLALKKPVRNSVLHSADCRRYCDWKKTTHLRRGSRSTMSTCPKRISSC